MAQPNLRAAADAAERHRDRAEALGVDNEELASWRDAAGDMLIPYDEVMKVHPQAEGFTSISHGTSNERRPSNYPLMLHYHYFDLYRKQVVKQADLVLALHLPRRRVQRRGEGARLRLLRAADGARLVALGVHAGGRRRRGRAPRCSPTPTCASRR